MNFKMVVVESCSLMFMLIMNSIEVIDEYVVINK